MSTIERAIRKLNGEDKDAPAEERAREDAERETVTPAGERPAPPVEQPAERASADPPVQASQAPARGDAGRVDEGHPRSENFIQLDLARLDAEGFITPDSPVSGLTEEYQQIKRRLLGNMVEGMADTEVPAPANLIMITSAVPGEGKTYTSVNLAMSLVREMDKTVLAIDTDIIKADMSRAFGVRDRPGLFDLLERDDLRLPELLVRTSIPNLVVLPAGQTHGNISEKLASEAMRRLTRELASRYRDRVVLFDSPPVLATTGATSLAPFIGQTVMVVEAETTPQSAIQAALQRLEHVKIAGLILNKARGVSHGHDYHYGYGYYNRVNE